ncbi:MAG TPA: hydrogenase maturation nickel metallochaperone HypA [Sulfurospirillum sp. UBA12182]|jgi:hydrogenase nickel incorporation protein HypA/HybF|nr:MAG TPA: hydrogenase maturation nickel metallochaperone HypA [Sulfurospirillum sp. UBA12182]
MHEFSIVNSLLDLCEANARKNNATKITKVEVKIGKLSGIEPHLLETAFNTFKEKTMCDGALFVMNMQDLIVKCQDCNKQFTLKENVFICPTCQGNLEVIDGEEMYLMRLEME